MSKAILRYFWEDDLDSISNYDYWEDSVEHDQ